MTAQEDDELFNWLVNASAQAGDFLRSVADAGLRADAFNYPLLRPFLLLMAQKYPQYKQGRIFKNE